jgi:SpoIID/LytB domain protein
VHRFAGLVAALALLGVAVVASQQPRPPTPARTANRQELPDTLRVGVTAGGSVVVRTLPLEAYVAGVLVGEAARDSAPAALDALAIAIRTYALHNLNRHRADGFDICDQTHCQVLRPATPATEQAALRTSGQILRYRGTLATVFYSASCGGRTEVPSAVWPGEIDQPYLPSRSDDGCGGDPVWSAELQTADLGRALLASGYRGRLRRLRVLTRDGSGRVGQIAVDGLTPSELSGQDLRMVVGRQVGWQYIKSTSFEMRRLDDRYRFEGRGSGHGVGMCVIGSTRLAARGQSAREILARYFPGTTIELLRDGAVPPAPPAPSVPTPAAPPPSPVPTAPVVTVPPSIAGVAANTATAIPVDASRRARLDLEALMSRSRLELASALDTAPAPAIALRIHDSTADYERATGLPWFTQAALQGGELHLVPIARLNYTGMLERVVRRELVRAIVDEPLSRRPLWVRAGAALYFSDPQRSENSSEVHALCPTDAELQSPVSAGALSNAYTRARACFARQIAAGRRWREVR